MSDLTRIAIDAAGELRRSPGYAALGLAERQSLDGHLKKIERALGTGYDPYAIPLATPADLQRELGGAPGVGRPVPQQQSGVNGAGSQQNRQTGAGQAPPPGTQVIGERARAALDAVDFSSFVAGLVTGTFRSIVDATAQQVREYAELVASISKTVDDFSRENVSPNQVRDYLAQKHPADLAVALPAPGREGTPRLVPRSGRTGGAAWLEQYGLDGQELDESLTEGPLLEAARRRLGEERMQSLATMVLMGINRIVVDQGQIRARLQFHASAKESTRAELALQSGGQAVGIAARQIQMQSQTQTMVSTVNVNAQADVSIKADLVGEVSIQFRTESFPLERFADSQAIQLIQTHARWQGQAARPAAPAAPGNAAAPPAAATPGTGEVA